jgi:AcrR family transcriptional regulator
LGRASAPQASGTLVAMTSLPEHLTAAPVGRERVSRKELDDRQRDRIIEAAIATIAKRGYRATTIDHIVSTAKVGVGTFYELYENKQDCFLQAYDRIVEPARERITAAVDADGDWGERARDALAEMLSLIKAEPLQARIALVEVQAAGDVALARYEEIFDASVPLLRGGREESTVAGELPGRLEEAIVGGLVWFLQQRITAGDLDSIELEEVLEIVIGPYLGAEKTTDLASATTT